MRTEGEVRVLPGPWEQARLDTLQALTRFPPRGAYPVELMKVLGWARGRVEYQLRRCAAEGLARDIGSWRRPAWVITSLGWEFLDRYGIEGGVRW